VEAASPDTFVALWLPAVNSCLAREFDFVITAFETQEPCLPDHHSPAIASANCSRREELSRVST